MHSNYISNKPTVPLQNCRCKGISYCIQINTVKLVEKSYYDCAIFFLQFPCIDYIIKSENLKEYKNIENKNSKKKRCPFLKKVALYIYLYLLSIERIFQVN